MFTVVNKQLLFEKDMP